jgi:hypothetical protein
VYLPSTTEFFMAQFPTSSAANRPGPDGPAIIHDTPARPVDRPGVNSANILNGGGNGIGSSILASTQFDVLTEGGSSTSIQNLLTGVKWGLAIGSAAPLTYSFYSPSSVYNYTTLEFGGFTFAMEPVQLNASQMAGAQAAMAAWANVSRVTFSAVSDSGAAAGDIRWGQSSNFQLTTAYANFPTSVAEGGDIWIGPNYPQLGNPVVGGIRVPDLSA